MTSLNESKAVKSNVGEQLHCVMFVSRNKDNQHVPHFKQRKTAFLTTRSKEDERLLNKFAHFKEEGQQGEMSRMYYSVNSRDNGNTILGVQHCLLDNPNWNAESLSSLAVKCAMRPENAVEKNRLFDFDLNCESKLNEFVQDLKTRGAKDVEVRKTPNGYAVVVKRGVDLRGLVSTESTRLAQEKNNGGLFKWDKSEVEYKKDGLLLVTWSTK